MTGVSSAPYLSPAVPPPTVEGRKLPDVVVVKYRDTLPKAAKQDFFDEKCLPATYENSKPANGNVFLQVDRMPTFNGGDIHKFREWIQSEIQYPESVSNPSDATYTVIVQFIVDKNGNVIAPHIIKSAGKTFDDEVLNAIKASPK